MDERRLGRGVKTREELGMERTRLRLRNAKPRRVKQISDDTRQDWIQLARYAIRPPVADIAQR